MLSADCMNVAEKRCNVPHMVHERGNARAGSEDTHLGLPLLLVYALTPPV